MARIRSIKPSFFMHDGIAELAPLTRLLFIGLWCLADRAGRLDDRPKRIKAELLPYDEVELDALLDDLAAAGFILRYPHASKRYIQIINFAKHQQPNIREAQSTIPAPCEYGTQTIPTPDEHMTSILGREGKGREGGGGARHGEHDVHGTVHVSEGPPPPPPPTPIEDPIAQKIAPILRMAPGEIALLGQIITRHRARGFTSEDIQIEAGKLAAKDSKSITARSFDRWLDRASPGSVKWGRASPPSEPGPDPRTAPTPEQVDPYRAFRAKTKQGDNPA